MTTSDPRQLRTTDGTMSFEVIGSPISGRSMQIVRALVSASQHPDFPPGSEVAVRALATNADDDAQRERLLALQQQTLGLLGLPHLRRELETQSGSDAVIIHPWLPGQSLLRYVQGRYPEGMPLDKALTVARAIATQLVPLHDERLIYRSLSPEHIVIGEDEEARLIGFANPSDRQRRPVTIKTGTDERYSAPEIVRELSGQFLHPRADVYSFGALMSFLATGEPPTDQVESPVSIKAWQRMNELPEGYRLLVAHCMQPFHKNRKVNTKALLPYLQSADTLPSRDSDGFGAIYLLAPWTGAANHAPVGNLTPGPLVSRATPPAAMTDAAEDSDGYREDAEGPASSNAHQTRDEPPNPESSATPALQESKQSKQTQPTQRRPRSPLFIALLTLWLAAVVLAIARFVGGS